MSNLKDIIGTKDYITCNSVLKMLDIKLYWWRKTRNFPWFRRGNEDIRYIYENTQISLTDVRGIYDFYEWRISFKTIEKEKFIEFIIELSNEGVSVPNIVKIIYMMSEYLETEKANKLLAPFDWFVPTKLE